MSNLSHTGGSWNSDRSKDLYWPQFLDQYKPTSDEYSIDWKLYMVHLNNKTINELKQTSKGYAFSFYTEHVVNTIFRLCDELSQPPEVRFLAVDLHDRFLRQHFVEYWEKNQGRGQAAEDQMFQHLCSLNTLRMLSCIQIASKVCCSDKVPTVKEIRQILAETFNQNCNQKTIVKSEFRVFKALNYKVPLTTPLTYLGMLLEDVRHLFQEMDKLVKVCMEVMNMATIQHKDIYLKLFLICNGNRDTTAQQKQRFIAIEGDNIYLATGVIGAAAVILDPTRLVSAEMVTVMSQVTEYKQKEIQLLGDLIVDAIIL